MPVLDVDTLVEGSEHVVPHCSHLFARRPFVVGESCRGLPLLRMDVRKSTLGFVSRDPYWELPTSEVVTEWR